jgi:hypothetical protein
MKIISKFTDYYDSYRSYGIEPGLIYPRTYSKERIERWRHTPPPYVSQFQDSVVSSVVRGKLYYCGYAYSYYHYTDPSKNVDKFIYNFDLFTKIGLARSIKKYEMWSVRNTFSEWKVDDSLFIEQGCPIFSVEWDCGIYLTKNPCLSSIAFQQVKTGMEVWRDLSHYIGNVMNQGDQAPTHVGDDNVIAVAKGHDPLISFRQGSPGEKKLRRKENKKAKKDRYKRGQSDPQ